MTYDISSGRSSIHHEGMSELVTAVSHRDDTFALAIPLKILSSPSMTHEDEDTEFRDDMGGARTHDL